MVLHNIQPFTGAFVKKNISQRSLSWKVPAWKKKNELKTSCIFLKPEAIPDTKKKDSDFGRISGSPQPPGRTGILLGSLHRTSPMLMPYISACYESAVVNTTSINLKGVFPWI